MSPAPPSLNCQALREIEERAKRGCATKRDLAVLVEQYQLLSEWIDDLMDNIPPEQPLLARLDRHVTIKFPSADHLAQWLARSMYDPQAQS